jgi:hypothetical protein
MPLSPQVIACYPSGFYLYLWSVYHNENQGPLNTLSNPPGLDVKVPKSDLSNHLGNIEEWYGQVCSLIYPSHKATVN